MPRAETEGYAGLRNGLPALIATLVFQTELFEYEEGAWTGRVLSREGELAKIQIGDDEYDVRYPGAVENQTAMGVWVRSSSKPKTPVIRETPAGRNVADWLGATLEGYRVAPPTSNEQGWHFKVGQELDSVLVEVWQVAPRQWQIQITNLEGCAPLAFFATPDRRLYQAIYLDIAGALQVVDGIQMLEKSV